MIENVFKNITTKKAGLNVYEEYFKEITKQDYKDYLHNTYINENKSKTEIAKLLGLTISIIELHLKKYNIKKPKVINADNVIYKTLSMIEKETGKEFIETYNELTEQGLSLTEIAIKLQIKRVGTISQYLVKYKRRQERLLNPINENDLLIKGLRGKKLPTVEKMVKEQLGIEYKVFLEQKYLKESYSLNEIADLIGISANALWRTMQKYNLHKSQSQIRKEVIDKGIIDLDEMHRKGRKTRNKSKSSNKQDLLITLLKYKLELIVQQNNNIEIVVGYNEYCILGSLEVDIPIIIFKDGKVYKIAIEYDGDVWHNERNTDSEKEKELNQKNWHLIRIEETSKDSANLEKVEEKANYIINKITEYVNQ